MLLGRNKSYEIFSSYKVLDHATGEYIGLGHLTNNEIETEEAEIGYMILPEYWGKGYGSKIAELLITLVRQLNFKTLKAVIDPENIQEKF